MTDAAGNGGFEAGGRGAGAEPAVEDLTGEPGGHGSLVRVHFSRAGEKGHRGIEIRRRAAKGCMAFVTRLPGGAAPEAPGRRDRVTDWNSPSLQSLDRLPEKWPTCG